MNIETELPIKYLMANATAGFVTIYSGPGDDHDIVGKLPNGEILAVEGRTTVGGSDRYWYKTPRGWIHAWGVAFEGEKGFAKPTGLFGKYNVTKADGSPVDQNAQYFVLRIDTDPAARKALKAYSVEIMFSNPEFSAQLMNWVNQYE